MKKLIITLILTLVVFTTNAEIIQQGKVFIEQSKVKKAQPAQKTEYVYIDGKGVSHPIYISANGKAFVIMTSSKTGKEYKKYLPEITQKFNNQKKVRWGKSK